MCIWFGYNPCINFCYFWHFASFVIFWPQILWKCIDSGYLVSATHTISCLSLCNFAHLFFPWFEDVHVVGFNPAVNFCNFSILLTLSFFAGATSTSPKFDLYFCLLLHKNIRCGCSLELPRPGDSNVYPQHMFDEAILMSTHNMFLWRIDENYPWIIMKYLLICYIWGSLLIWVLVGQGTTVLAAGVAWVDCFCRTCFSMGDLGMQVSVRLSIRLSVRPSTFTLGVLWAQLLLQFCTNLFETWEVFSSCYEDVHVVWI